MVACSVRICSALGAASDTDAPAPACASNSRHARPRKRCTPSTLRVLHTLVSRSGPINISYRRSESAPASRLVRRTCGGADRARVPYALTTSSGLTTLPRLLLILCALAATRTEGSALRTYLGGDDAVSGAVAASRADMAHPSPFLTTSSAESFTTVAAPGRTLSSAEMVAPEASRRAVYSTSPRIMPWLTSFWKGS